MRLLLALAAKNGWQIHHLDVKTTFLNGEIQEEFMLLNLKALLKKVKNIWRTCVEALIVGVYVDDLLITGTSTSIISEFKQQMNDRFKMNDLRRLSYYLGMEVQQMKDCIELKQSAYARKTLEKAGMQACNPTKYPMDPKEHLTKDEGGKLVDPTEYKSLVGGLHYLVNTRPDIAYAVGIVNRFMEKPTVVHKNAVKLKTKFKRIQDKYKSFYYAYDVDSDGRLTKLFWADSIGRRNFELYGDAISFDTTFDTNRYNLFFAPFTGVDKHDICVTFASCLLSYESVADYN
ncbi:hypothetical protein AgCh_000640 [Apium graveolens]